MKPYQIVVIYAKRVGFIQVLLHAVLLGICWHFFILVERTENAVPTMMGNKQVYVLTEHGDTFEWPLAAEKDTTKFHLIQAGLTLASISLCGLIVYNVRKLMSV